MLWCYKKELGFSTHRQKRMRQIKKQQQRGLYDPSKDDPFELFIASTDIRWCYYKETHKVLGSTYGMCVLQDFEAVTPNIMARTIETVEGGGVVVLLLRTMDSLKQLYTMSMDVHARFRTESHQDVVARFNERFILSLASCERCVVLDDELNVLPISKHTRKIEPLPRATRPRNSPRTSWSCRSSRRRCARRSRSAHSWNRRARWTRPRPSLLSWRRCRRRRCARRWP